MSRRFRPLPQSANGPAPSGKVGARLRQVVGQALVRGRDKAGLGRLPVLDGASRATLHDDRATTLGRLFVIALDLCSDHGSKSCPHPPVSSTPSCPHFANDCRSPDTGTPPDNKSTHGRRPCADRTDAVDML
jgi:hypothetical protein